jgi:hypothetical protein
MIQRTEKFKLKLVQNDQNWLDKQNIDKSDFLKKMLLFSESSKTVRLDSRDSRAAVFTLEDFQGELSMLSKQCSFVETSLTQWFYDMADSYVRTGQTDLCFKCCTLLYVWNFSTNKRKQVVQDSQDGFQLKDQRNRHANKLEAPLEVHHATETIPPTTTKMLPVVPRSMTGFQDEKDLVFVLDQICQAEDDDIDKLLKMKLGGLRALIPKVNEIEFLSDISQRVRTELELFVRYYIKEQAPYEDKYKKPIKDYMEWSRWDRINKDQYKKPFVLDTTAEDKFDIEKEADSNQFVNSIGGLRLPPFIIGLFFNAGFYKFTGTSQVVLSGISGVHPKNTQLNESYKRLKKKIFSNLGKDKHFDEFNGVCNWSQPDVNNRPPTMETVISIREGLYKQEEALDITQAYTVMPYIVENVKYSSEPITPYDSNDLDLEGDPCFGSLEDNGAVSTNLFRFITNQEYKTMYAADKDSPEKSEPFIVFVRAIQHMSLKYADFKKRTNLEDLYMDLVRSIHNGSEEGNQLIASKSAYLANLDYSDVFAQTKNLLQGLFPIRLAIIDGGHRLYAFLSALLDIELVNTGDKKKPQLILEKITAISSFNVCWPNCTPPDSAASAAYTWKVRFLGSTPKNPKYENDLTRIVLFLTGHKSPQGVFETNSA